MRRRPLVLSHWYKAFEDFQVAPREFYGSVEDAVKRREIPGLQMERARWQEGGALSASREYLRITHGRVKFDLCAAPFGTGFFFSTWVAQVPPRGLALAYFFGFNIAFNLACLLFVKLGFSALNAFMFTILCSFALAVCVNGGLFGNEEAVRWMPLYGRLYERIFHPDTYFKEDSETVFWEFVHAAVMETIEAETTVKGIRGLTDEERRPILGPLGGAPGEATANVPRVA